MPEKSKIQTELDFFAAVEAGDTVSQLTLAKRISISVGLVNALIRRAASKGFVKIKEAPRKRYTYYLTPKGFAEKSRLVAEYLDNSLSFFRRARREYAESFVHARAQGLKRIAFVGSGELAEIALMAAHEAEIDVVLVVDRTTNKDRLYGITVAHNIEALVGQVDGVVITEARTPQHTFDALAPHFSGATLLTPPLLCIVRPPSETDPVPS
ncbi:MAG: hypothetical protein JXQ84_00550 [Rhodospirillaceae bacterium]|nr:hypothetical protein [Rhodospirillaceae bacterium]